MIIKRLFGIIISIFLLLPISLAEELILFSGDIDYGIEQNTLLINEEDATGDMKLQFGSSLNEFLLWDEANSYFTISNDLNFNGNEIINFRLENNSSAPTCDINNVGRQYYNTSSKNGFICIEESASVYNWAVIATTTTATSKVVTVGSGGNYATIAEAATYLNGLTGGIILLTPEIHQITTSVDLENINLIGASETDTKILIVNNGQIIAKNTQFDNMIIEADSSLSSDYGINVKDGTGTNSALLFKWVNFITEDDKFLMNSSLTPAPTVITRFVSPSSSISGTANIVPAQASTNFNSGSTFFIGAQGGNGSLNFSDWDIALSGSVNAVTTGNITTYPSSTIFAYPEMNLQALINSLPSGGIITLLPGTHEIEETVNINHDNIEIIGYGDSSVIKVLSSFSGSSTTTSAIQIGSADGSTPVDNVILKDFKLEVDGPSIHGIRATGGKDIQLYNITVIKTSGQSGSGDSARIGIQFLDGTSEDLLRPVIKNCRIFGDSTVSSYFTDGIHVSGGDGYGSGSGVWTNGNTIRNALIESNNVDYVRETVAVFVGVEDSSLYNNRFSRMGAGTWTSYGIFIGDSSRVNMTANVVSGSLSSNSQGIVIEGFGGPASRQVTDSNFSSNTIDGTANSGSGFNRGFTIGSSDSDTEVHRNIFQGNVVKGASDTSDATAFYTEGNNDDNIFANNMITGGTYSWDIGIDIDSSSDRTLISNNKFENTTEWISDNSSNTSLGASQHLDTSNPDSNDDIDDGYAVGTIWVNTSNDRIYVNIENTSGSAHWERLRTY